MKNLKFFLAVSLLALMASVPVQASDVSEVSLPAGVKTETDLFAAGDPIDVGNDVGGDLILAGGNVNVSGNVDGDALLAAGNARIKGDTAGDVRVIGGNVELDGAAGKNVTIAGGSVILGEDSIAAGNVYVAGGNVEIRGEVKGNIVVYASQIIFAGKVGGNADFRSNKIIIRDDARIGGNLSYSSNAEAAIKEGVVAGSVTRVPMPEFTYDTSKHDDTGGSLGMIIWGFLSLFIMWLSFDKLFGKQVHQLIGPITKEEIWGRIASGLIALVVNLIAIFLIFITLVGMPLALFILFTYIVLLIAAAAIMPVMVGRMANTRAKLYVADEGKLWKDFIFGYVILQLAALIPVLGWVAIILLFLFAFGRVTKFVYGAVKNNR